MRGRFTMAVLTPCGFGSRRGWWHDVGAAAHINRIALTRNPESPDSDRLRAATNVRFVRGYFMAGEVGRSSKSLCVRSAVLASRSGAKSRSTSSEAIAGTERPDVAKADMQRSQVRLGTSSTNHFAILL